MPCLHSAYVFEDVFAKIHRTRMRILIRCSRVRTAKTNVITCANFTRVIIVIRYNFIVTFYSKYQHWVVIKPIKLTQLAMYVALITFTHFPLIFVQQIEGIIMF